MKFQLLLGLAAVVLAASAQAQDAVAPSEEAAAVAPIEEAATVAPVEEAATVAPSEETNAFAPLNEESPTATPAPADEDAARAALAKKEGDADGTSLLKSTLTAVDKQYSMIKRGSKQLTYDLNYTYVGQQTIVTDLASGNATLFNIQNNNTHTLTNAFSLDYGVRNNVTANLTVPVMSRYAQTAAFDGVSNALGDISLGARLQPFEAQRDAPSLTLSGAVRLPTGTNPFKIIAGSGLASGSGVVSFTGGANVSKIVDPVALFGSLSMTYSLAAKNVNQALGSATLTEVRPGLSAGFGLGFAYALSYDISTSFSFQESISAGSKLTFDNGQQSTTQTQTSGILNLGLGYRISPKTTINTTIGIGLTVNSPNLSIDVSIPISL